MFPNASGANTGALLRQPLPDDGAAVHKLISSCRPLDENSLYCNLVQCTHFNETATAAFIDNELVGFTSGYRIPRRRNTLFVWQVAVGEAARGQGLAQRMILDTLKRPANHDITYIETTINPANDASWALFRKLADSLKAEQNKTLLFEKEKHFEGSHEDEILLRVGPFDINNLEPSQ